MCETEITFHTVHNVFLNTTKDYLTYPKNCIILQPQYIHYDMDNQGAKSVALRQIYQEHGVSLARLRE